MYVDLNILTLKKVDLFDKQCGIMRRVAESLSLGFFLEFGQGCPVYFSIVFYSNVLLSTWLVIYTYLSWCFVLNQVHHPNFLLCELKKIGNIIFKFDMVIVLFNAHCYHSIDLPFVVLHMNAKSEPERLYDC